MKQTKCSTCAKKIRCLANHHIPDNYGKDCKQYLDEKIWRL